MSYSILRPVKGRPYVLTASGTGYNVYRVTSGRKFYLTNLVITNDASTEAVITIYDAASSATPEFKILVPLRNTTILSEDDLEKLDLEFLSSVNVWTDVSGVWIRVGGYEV